MEVNTGTGWRIAAGVLAWVVGGVVVVASTDGLAGAAIAAAGTALQAAFLVAEHARYRRRSAARWWVARTLVNAGLAFVALIVAVFAALGVFAYYEARQPEASGGWAMLVILPVAVAVAFPPTVWLLARRTARSGARRGVHLRRADTAAVVLASLMLPSVVLGCLKVLVALSG